MKTIKNRKFNISWRPSLDSSQNKKIDQSDYFSCKELVQFFDKTASIKQMDRYSHVIIEWVRDWSNTAKQEILIDSLILNKGW